MRIVTEKYMNINHYHEIREDQQKIILRGKEIIADKNMIDLLITLNNAGLKTRTHCGGHGSGEKFLSIVFDKFTEIQVRKVRESSSSREDYNDKTEFLISWVEK